jgi:hypothetical protein
VANKQQGGDGRRQTKAERKADARVERERIQRHMSSRKRNRNIGVALVAIAVVAIVIAVVITQAGGGGGQLPTATGLLAKASSEAKTAGCDAVATIGPYNGVAADPNNPNDPNYVDQSHIGPGGTFTSMPPLSSYPSQPPTSGPHNQTPLAGGVFDVPPAIDSAIHSLEHGGTIVWYDPEASGDQLAQIKEFYKSASDSGGDRVIVAPYSYPDQGAAGTLPPGVQMALVAWHRLETCSQPNLAAALDFTSQYSAPPTAGRTYAGEAPEAGKAM